MGRFLPSFSVWLCAGLVVSVIAPGLAQQSAPATTTRLEGPVLSVPASTFEAALREQATACGMQADALTIAQGRGFTEPATPEAEAALEERVEAISAKAGFTGPKESRQVSRASIRAMLTQRLTLTLAYTGVDSGADDNEGMACFLAALAEAGFSPADASETVFTQSDADAIADACKAPRAWLIVEPGSVVRFEPPVEADYEASACILDRIKASGVTRFGFVGNDKAPAE